jgi:hypothetical protein
MLTFMVGIPEKYECSQEMSNFGIPKTLPATLRRENVPAKSRKVYSICRDKKVIP